MEINVLACRRIGVGSALSGLVVDFTMIPRALRAALRYALRYT
jgi:hypothetical protein